jgi:UDP-N-acetylglucosamine diphosphorylase/glucosamine-1-phosphate N-acetyltransferase
MFILILAGGLGKRMKSNIPKVLHLINDKPMIVHVVERAFELNPSKIFIIVGIYKQIINETINKYFNNDKINVIHYIDQSIALGTGHAIKCALPTLQQFSNNNDNINNNYTLILSGDVPLISNKTLANLTNNDTNKLLITQLYDQPNNGCGRIIFNKNNAITDIIEQKDCSTEQLHISYVNCGIYYIKTNILLELIPLIENNNCAKEYYLTDIVKLMNQYNYSLNYYELDQSNKFEIINVNTPHELIEANIFYSQKC